MKRGAGREAPDSFRIIVRVIRIVIWNVRESGLHVADGVVGGVITRDAVLNVDGVGGELAGALQTFERMRPRVRERERVHV